VLVQRALETTQGQIQSIQQENLMMFNNFLLVKQSFDENLNFF